MKIIPLSEGTFTIDKTKIFVPFDTGKDDLQKRPIGSLLVEVQPFCVITNQDILLLDTGLGFNINGEPQIYQNLIAKGIQPTQITKVLMSHLHKDHAGGISFRNNIGHYSLAFPNATYYVQQKEFEFAMDTGYPSYITDEFATLYNNPNVEWLNENGTIDNYIQYTITGAHSPYHQVFSIKENKETIFFGADDAPQLKQMKNKFMAKYDFDGKKAMELRQQWWQQGNNENWHFLFYHDIKTPVYQ
ncbi:MAG: MBL fold metallo-hydrolase [Chitinophagaceae bacterium]|nr:MBL fold metallo-hydrolase [Chitinophagaceae bacterium]MCW5904508.1 MBL fold metallo-hydrolase [Chitinophagaceae bacterium]